MDILVGEVDEEGYKDRAGFLGIEYLGKVFQSSAYTGRKPER